MGVIDDFRQEKNKMVINVATEKMIMDKYNLNIDKLELKGIVEKVIISICNDAILIKRIGKLIELNTIALTKIKDYIEVNIINKSANSANTVISDELKTSDDVIDSINKYNTDELLSKVIELEEKRKTVNTLASAENANINISSEHSSTISAGTPNTTIGIPGTPGTTQQSPSISYTSFQPTQTYQKYSLVNNVNVENLETIAYIIEKMESIMNNKKNINYKTLIINSYNRDWTIYNNRNNLSLSINIDLTKNIIEPKKLLMPKYVKNITPYITMTINDGKKTQKFQFILSVSATTATTATTAIKARKEPGHKEDTHKPNMDSSKEVGKGTIGAVGAGCDKGCDKCSMEMPKKKNIFNEMAVDNFVPYITEENLLAAQTNIIDVYNYNLCINNDDIETLDVKRGPLCDIQGLQDIPDLGDNKRLRGYDTYHSRLGNLTYDIL